MNLKLFIQKVSRRLFGAKKIFNRDIHTALTYSLGTGNRIDECVIASTVLIRDNCYIYNTKIDEHTYISSDASIMNTTIGKFCSIAQGVKICTGSHPSSIFVTTHPAFFSLHKQSGITFVEENHFREMGKCIIGNDVWIGNNVVILDDIIIGDGAIIGAGAIITKDIPPYAVVLGIPGKIKRFRFNSDEIDFLLKFKWWDKDDEWLKKNHLLFLNIKSFVKYFK
ncbi:MAG: CatB-related O-acetyltransferase [Pedobacter sp.]|nr:MAG: CatB-related O-acetyltransferase [Pedobacter sp.]